MTAYRNWYAQRDEGFIHPRYHRPGTSDMTNYISAHLDCLHTVTNRYSPVLIGPQKSTATSFQGLLGMGVMRNCSLSCDMLTTWHGWQCWMCTSTIMSSPGNHTLVRRNTLVLVLPWWPSCASLTTLSRSVLGTTIRGPRTTSSPTTANSVKMASGPECSLLLRREVSSGYGSF